MYRTGLRKGLLAALLVGSLVGAGCAWFLPPDDYFESNDTLDEADANPRADLSSDAGFRLTEIDSGGANLTYLDDYDYYKITLSADVDRILIACEFSVSYGDIDLYLYDASGTEIGSSRSTADNEYLCYYDLVGDVPAGDYYVLAFLADGRQNTYDLWWHSVPSDGSDPYEPNEDSGSATALPAEGQWLSAPGQGGSWAVADGYVADQDWYSVTMPTGTDTIEIWCDFYHAFGDVDVHLYDSTPTLLKSAVSITDDEYLKCTGLVGDDTYYIMIWIDGAAANCYDFYWQAE